MKDVASLLSSKVLLLDILHVPDGSLEKHFWRNKVLNFS